MTDYGKELDQLLFQTAVINYMIGSITSLAVCIVGYLTGDNILISALLWVTLTPVGFLLVRKFMK